MKTFVSTILILFLYFEAKAVTKIACIGASITYGATVPDRDHNSYPGQLQSLLGSCFVVNNYGVSGTTLLKHGNLPYWKTKEY